MNEQTSSRKTTYRGIEIAKTGRKWAVGIAYGEDHQFHITHSLTNAKGVVDQFLAGVFTGKRVSLPFSA